MHEGHRKRMRERYLASESFDGFSNVDILESLLYHSIPRGNTNPCAHALLERFGSLKAVFEASVDELCTVKGMGERSAILFKLVLESMRRYERDLTETVSRYDSMSKIKAYLHHLFLGLDRERLYLLLFNNRMNLLDCVLISEGVVNGTDMIMRKMVERAMNKKAAAAILAHNHPNGLAIPSGADKEMTDIASNALDLVNVTLVEHFVVNELGMYPIMRRHYSMYRPSPYTGNIEPGFYERFYDIETGECRFAELFPDEPAKSERDAAETAGTEQ